MFIGKKRIFIWTAGQGYKFQQIIQHHLTLQDVGLDISEKSSPGRISAVVNCS